MKRIINIIIVICVLLLETGSAIGIFLFGELVYYDVYLEIQEDKHQNIIDSYLNDALNNPNNALEYIGKICKTATDFRDIYPYLDKSVEIHDAIVSILKHASENMNAEAQYYLARYYKGWEVAEEIPITISDPDYEKAAYWFSESAGNGYVKAYGRLALCYWYGQGVEQNFIKCIDWLTKGANDGSSYAQYFLGCAYETGLSYKYNADNGNYYWYNGVATKDWGTEDSSLKKGDYIFYVKGGKNTYLNRNWLKRARWTKTQTFLEKDLDKAKYYWKLAAEGGYDDAKEKLQRLW